MEIRLNLTMYIVSVLIALAISIPLVKKDGCLGIMLVISFIPFGNVIVILIGSGLLIADYFEKIL